MLTSSKGIVLRAVKYGDTSVVATVFTRNYGLLSFLVKGVRTMQKKGRQGKAGLLQPSTILNMSWLHKPDSSLHYFKEFEADYLYMHLQEDVVKNSIALFSIECILRLLPQQAPQSELFDFTEEYFQELDRLPGADVSNFPLYFLIQCSAYLGYSPIGEYCEETPYLNLQEGGYTAQPPVSRPLMTDEDAMAIDALRRISKLQDSQRVKLNSDIRFRLLEWYISFLHRHTDHMGSINSLPILRLILR